MIENGFEGFVEVFEWCWVEWVDKIVRGIVFFNEDFWMFLYEFSVDIFVKFYVFGVCFIWVYGVFGIVGLNVGWVIE